MRGPVPSAPGGASPDERLSLTLQALRELCPQDPASSRAPSSSSMRRGVGLQLSAKLEVISLVPGGAGAMSGAIQPGDVLLEIDGAGVQGMQLAPVRALLQGPPGSNTVLTLRCKQTARDKEVTLVRGQAQAGVGMVLRRNDGKLSVHRVEPGGAAHEGGVVVGDVVEYIDGQSVRGKTVHEVVPMIVGEEGSLLTLVVRRKPHGDQVTLGIHRASRDSLDGLGRAHAPGQDEDSACSISERSHAGVPQHTTPYASLRYDSATRTAWVEESPPTKGVDAGDREQARGDGRGSAESRPRDEGDSIGDTEMQRHIISRLDALNDLITNSLSPGTGKSGTLAPLNAGEGGGGGELMRADEQTIVVNHARDRELEELKAFAQAELQERDSRIHFLQQVIHGGGGETGRTREGGGRVRKMVKDGCRSGDTKHTFAHACTYSSCTCGHTNMHARTHSHILCSR